MCLCDWDRQGDRSQLDQFHDILTRMEDVCVSMLSKIEAAPELVGWPCTSPSIPENGRKMGLIIPKTLFMLKEIPWNEFSKRKENSTNYVIESKTSFQLIFNQQEWGFVPSSFSSSFLFVRLFTLCPFVEDSINHFHY